MYLFYDWLRIPVACCVFFLRLFSLGAAIATLAGFVMENKYAQLFCFTAFPAASFASHALAFKIAANYERLMQRLEPAPDAR